MEGKLNKEEIWDGEQPVLSRLTEKSGGELTRKTMHSFNSLPPPICKPLSQHRKGSSHLILPTAIHSPPFSTQSLTWRSENSHYKVKVKWQLPI